MNISLAGRIVAIHLAAVYLLFSVGILKATHLCMGRVASVSYFSSETKKCACSYFAKEKDDCCDNDHEVLRLDDDHQLFSANSLMVPQLFFIAQLSDFQHLSINKEALSIKDFTLLDDRPPSIPIFQQHCSYIFYDSSLMIS